MKKRYWIFIAAISIWLFAMLGTIPELRSVWPERKAVRETFTDYVDALKQGNFEKAYQHQSPEFQELVPLSRFIEYQREVQVKLGNLKYAKEKGLTVHKSRNPSRWTASVIADLYYDKAVVRYTFELHRNDVEWQVFSSSGVEK